MNKKTDKPNLYETITAKIVTEVIAEIMHEAIAERVKMKDLTNRIAAECGKPIREQGPLISLNRLLSWFERSNLPHEKRQAGLAHLRDLRKLIEEVE